MSLYINHNRRYSDDCEDRDDYRQSDFRSHEPNGELVSGGVELYEGYSPNAPAEFDVSSVQLPPPNMDCYHPPTVCKGSTRHVRYPEETIQRTVEQDFSDDAKTLYKETNVHHYHVKNILINLIRRHNHNIKVVNNENHFHHFLTNNIVRVLDAHHQRFQQVKGESKNINDYKQTHRVEGAECREVKGGAANSTHGGVSGTDIAIPNNNRTTLANAATTLINSVISHKNSSKF